MASIGKVTLDLELRLAQFERDFARAAEELSPASLVPNEVRKPTLTITASYNSSGDLSIEWERSHDNGMLWAPILRQLAGSIDQRTMQMVTLAPTGSMHVSGSTLKFGDTLEVGRGGRIRVLSSASKAKAARARSAVSAASTARVPLKGKPGPSRRKRRSRP